MIKYITKDMPQYKANLHSHSNLSDGELTPEQLKEAYKSHGYSILSMKKFKFYAELLKGQTVRYLIVVFLGILISLIPLCSNYLIKSIVDDVIAGGRYSLIMPILITFMTLTVIRMLIWYYNQYTLVVIGQDVGLKMRQRCFKKILSLDFSYFDKHRTGDIMTMPGLPKVPNAEAIKLENGETVGLF